MDWERQNFVVNKSESAIVDTVKKFGFCILPKFFDKNIINDLKIELDNFTNLNETSKNSDNYEEHYSFHKNDKGFKNYKLINQIITLSFFSNTAKTFYSPEKSQFNNSRYVICLPHENESNQLPFIFHSDRNHCFKFFILLEDINKDDGPTTVVPGQHINQKQIRRDFISAGNYAVDRNNILASKNYNKNETFTLTGKKGDVIVLETDIPHKAGHVKPGHKRLIWRIDFCSLSEWGKSPKKITLGKITNKIKRILLKD
tara:strand:+ start:1287 stop:2060 length:774 start_codon:yes stop_codon:yes gene_type:complete